MDSLDTLPLPPRRRHVLAAILISAVVVSYYLPQVLRGRSLGEGEGVTFYLPMRELVADAWSNGHWPLWNPYTYCGMPLLADCQAGTFYPPNLTYLFFEPTTAMNIIMLAGHLIGLWGIIFLLRAYRVSAWASAAGAIAFVFSGFLVAHMGHVSIANAAVWLPWLCLVTHYWCLEGRRRWLIVGALLWAIQFLAGHPQIVVYSAIIVAMQLVVLWRRGMGRCWRRVGGLALMAGLAILLCGIQILPTLSLSAETGRNFEPSLELFQRYHLPIGYTPLLWLPCLYGTHTTTPLNWTWWGDWNFVELAGYAGLLPWMLLPAACCLPGGKVRFGRAWAIIGGLHLLLAWNTDTPLGRLLFHLPIYNSFEAVGRHLLGLILALSICTGVGLEALGETIRPRRLRWSRRGCWAVAFIVLAVVVGGIWGYMYASVHFDYSLEVTQYRPAVHQSPWAEAPWAFIMPIVITILSAWALLRYARIPGSRSKVLVLAVLFIDVASAGYLCAWRWRYEGIYRPSPPPGELARLLESSDPNQPPPRYLLFGPWPPVYSIAAQANMLYRLASMNGYGPFQLKRFHEMVGGMNHDGLINNESLLQPSRALDLWSCRYVIAYQSGDSDTLPAALNDSSQYRLVKTLTRPDGGELHVYENINALPHARFVKGIVAPGGDDAVLSAINMGRLDGRREYDPGRIALAGSEHNKNQLAASRPATSPSAPQRTVRWLAYKPDRLRLETRTPADSILVLAEPFVEGWQAYIDEKALPITRVDYMLRAVSIPAGTHVLEMRYEPTPLKLGLYMSIAGLVGLFITLVWPRRHTPTASRVMN